MTTPLPDTLITPVVVSLLACLCEEFRRGTTGPVCRCCWEPGPVPPPMDSCQCDCAVSGGTGHGHAWIRVASAAPTTFPALPARTCRVSRAWTVTLEVGVYRCAIGVPDEYGNPPTCAQTSLDAQVVQADAAALRRAVSCCGPLAGRLVAVNWVPLGPSGGCVGSALTVTADLIQAPISVIPPTFITLADVGHGIETATPP